MSVTRRLSRSRTTVSLPLWSATARTPENIWMLVCPCALTSTANSVPRTEQTAVGVRTSNRRDRALLTQARREPMESLSVVPPAVDSCRVKEPLEPRLMREPSSNVMTALAPATVRTWSPAASRYPALAGCQTRVPLLSTKTEPLRVETDGAAAAAPESPRNAHAKRSIPRATFPQNSLFSSALREYGMITT